MTAPMPWRKTILDLCGGTGMWSEPYAEAGYNVIIVDPYSPVEGAVLEDVRLYVPPADVRGVLAAPPCTMFSFARTTAKKPRDFKEGLALVDACLRIITVCKPQWWALENPVGFLRRFLGEPALTFQPCDYGDAYTKRTDLWGSFTPPETNLVQVEKQPGREFGAVRGWSFARTGRDGLTRQQVRSITPPAFARAFFEANP